MKVRWLYAVALGLVCFGLASCGYEGRTNITVVEKEAGLAKDGLDLQAVGEIAKKARNAEDLERQLNQPEGINNLDLDGNGQVDYINVTEFGGKGSAYGFSLHTNFGQGDDQELATIQIEKTPDNQANIAVAGNANYYGAGSYYHATVPLGELILWSWLLAPHAYWYHPPYYFGFYPSYYHGYYPVTRTAYANRTTAYTRGGTFASSRTSTIQRPAVSPVRSSTKSFQQRSAGKSVQSGGFGSSSGSQRSASRSYQAPKQTYRSSRSGCFGRWR